MQRLLGTHVRMDPQREFVGIVGVVRQHREGDVEIVEVLNELFAAPDEPIDDG